MSNTPQAIDYLHMPRCDMVSTLYPIVDSVLWMQKLLDLGIKTIQLRIKNNSETELNTTIEQATNLARQYQAHLFINYYWQLAIKYYAYGVHLGQEDILEADIKTIRDAGLQLGISTHGEYEFSYAATFKPSYIAIGSIFPTNTKKK